MSEPEEDFAAMFEASLKAKRFEKGQTIEGTIVAIGPEVAFVDVGGKGEAHDRHRRAEGRRRRSRGRGRRSHPGDGGVDRGRADALPEAGARRRDRPAARRRVPRRPAGRRQGRTGGEGRIRGAHRRASAPSARSRRSTSCARRPGGARWAASTSSGSSSTRKAAGTSSSRGARCSRRSSGRSAAEVRRSIVAGAVMTGRVASVREFGAFVDLGGGVQGLLHVSEMGWSRVSDTVAGRQARRGDHRQGAARRRGQAEDLARAEAARPTIRGRRCRRPTRSGQVRTGRVTRVAEFGAFVELEPGIEGAGARVHVRADRPLGRLVALGRRRA